MEKRWCERKALFVDVDIYQQGEFLGSGKLRDIGLCGALLNTASPLDVPRETNVELVFRLSEQDRGVRHRVSARVARLTESGDIGCKFCGFDTSVFRSLQEIMAYCGSTASSR